MAKVIKFPRWAELMQGATLSASEKKSFKVTIRWYLGWCRRQGVGRSVLSAKAFIDWARHEKKASDWMVEQWKAAIRWFFETAKAQATGPSQPQLRGEEAVEHSDSSPSGPATSRRNFGIAVEGSNAEDEVPFPLVNDTDAERVEAKSEDDQTILAIMRLRGMSLDTERSYLHHYRNFKRREGLMHGTEMRASSIRSYLNYLAMERAVAVSSQKQALNALVFVAREGRSLTEDGKIRSRGILP